MCVCQNDTIYKDHISFHYSNISSANKFLIARLRNFYILFKLQILSVTGRTVPKNEQILDIATASSSTQKDNNIYNSEVAERVARILENANKNSARQSQLQCLLVSLLNII